MKQELVRNFARTSAEHGIFKLVVHIFNTVIISVFAYHLIPPQNNELKLAFLFFGIIWIFDIWEEARMVCTDVQFFTDCAIYKASHPVEDEESESDAETELLEPQSPRPSASLASVAIINQ